MSEDLVWYRDPVYVQYDMYFSGDAVFNPNPWMGSLYGQGLFKFLAAHGKHPVGMSEGFYSQEIAKIKLEDLLTWFKEKGFEILFQGQEDVSVVYFAKDDCFLTATFMNRYDENGEQIYKKQVLTGNSSRDYMQFVGFSSIDFSLKSLYAEFEKSFNCIKELPEENTREMYIIGTDPSGGLSLQSVGLAGIKLDLDHYSAKIHKEIKLLASELGEINPSGRLNIIEGPPGTGKTYLLRGLIDSVEMGRFIYVPAALIPQLANPSFVSLLVNSTSRRNSAFPLILLLEDADKVLLDRKTDNLESISNLLNLTSGILGDSLNIRIVCTTNAELEDLDDAVKRDGRLACHIHVGNLTVEEANSLYMKLTGKSTNCFGAKDGDSIDLAKVYKEAFRVGIKKTDDKLRNSLTERTENLMLPDLDDGDTIVITRSPGGRMPMGFR